MSIGFQADRSVASRNECLGLTVVARNDSSTAVDNLRINISQETCWVACGYMSRTMRVVASIVVPGSQLGDVGQGVGAGNERKRSFVKIAAEAQTELRDLLTSGAGVRHELTISECALEGIDIKIIKVRHWLSVSLKTPTCITDPEVSMPLTIQSMPVGIIQVGESDSAPLPPSYIGEAQLS